MSYDYNTDTLPPAGGAAPSEPVDRNVKKPWNEVRYKEMDPKAKAELRKQERDFKKDRDRTMGYFNSVSKAITDVGASLEDGSMDQQSAAEAFHAIADGFLTEFQKKLKTDVTIFRNSGACRVIEMVCTKADLVQTKTFMYILLGKVGDLMHSPTASFVFETILASLYRNVGLLMTANGANGQQDDLLGEMQSAEAGAAGHGLPPYMELLSSWVEEACECMESLVTDIPGSRSLRTMMMMLSGRPIRGVKPFASPPQFPDLLLGVTEAATIAIEDVYTGAAAEKARLAAEGGEDGDGQYRKPVKGNVSASEAWLTACCAPTTCAVVQALLIVDLEEVLSTKLGRMYLRGSSVMQHLLDNIVGARVVQSFLRTAPHMTADGTFDAEIEAAAAARWETVLKMVLNHPKLEEVIATPAAVIEKMSFESPEAAAANAENDDTVAEGEEGQQLTNSYYTEEGGNGNSYEGGEEESYNTKGGHKRGRDGDNSDPRGTGKGGKFNNNKGNGNSSNTPNSGLQPTVSPLFFLFQDLITYCPTEELLTTLLWDELLSPRLNALISNPEYGAILTRFTRKCAFHGINALEDALNPAEAAKTTPSNHIKQGQLEEPNVRSDILNGARYFVVAPSFRESVVNEICRALKQKCMKGAAQALLVEKVLGETHSAAISYNLLHMGAKPSSHFFNAVDKLRVDDLVAASTTASGACVFQRFILTAIAKDALSTTSTTTTTVTTPAPTTNKNTSASAAAATATTTIVKRDTGALIRFIRRIVPHLPTLVANKYAGYVVECAYDHASIEGKEEIVKNLVSFYQTIVNEDTALRTERHGGAVGFGAVHSLDPVSRNIAKKVMVRCCVEQYVHRREDWLKLAERQSNVKRMMVQILANDTL